MDASGKEWWTMQGWDGWRTYVGSLPRTGSVPHTSYPFAYPSVSLLTSKLYFLQSQNMSSHTFLDRLKCD